MRWFDAGVNCFDDRLPLAETLEAARTKGVDRMCVIATHQRDWDKCLAWASQYPENLCCTIGVHPHYADGVSADWLTQLTHLANTHSVSAIGECGLDFNRMFSTQENQLHVFEQQLRLAADLKLPVYLHERDAFDQQYQLLSEYHSTLVGGLVHCFTSHKEHLKAYLDLGFYIGITGWICDPKRGDALRDALQYLPLDRLILETDSPYLFPKGFKPRTRNNTPAHLPYIAQQVADLKNITVEQVNQVSIINTTQLLWR
ncbi:TatD family hydrolase [Alteromonas facilis]|uniref:TatD family hydrolase n=1 Tax=Alteromonas facilis TaxID=2048004 RepID=UPI000C29139C|nr:TatD family hydrolase [Alteromonas facilis]